MDVALEGVRRSPKNHYLLVPNLNRSDRDLPDAPAERDIASGIALDKDRPSRRLSDKEIYSVIIDVSKQEVAAHKGLKVKVAFDARLFTALSKSAVPIAADPQGEIVIDLEDELRINGTKSRGVQMFLEARTFWGSPAVPADVNRTVSFTFLDGSGVLKVVSTIDGGAIRSSDLVLVGDDAPPQRIFMCELFENQPSVVELRAAVSAIGVPLTIVPANIGAGDTWLQDQFQIGYTGNNERLQQVIVHLPRMVHDSALVPGTPNLRNFVDNHFPSTDIAVLKDFWAVTLNLSDGGADRTKTLSVAESYLVYATLLYQRQILENLMLRLERLDATQKGRYDAFDFDDILAVRLEMEIIHGKLTKYTNLDEEARRAVRNLRRLIDDKGLRLIRGQMEVPVLASGKAATLFFDTNNKNALNEFFKKLHKIHSQHNYGGNIEVSPPMPDAPYGKIVTGTLLSDEVEALLTSRGASHPRVSVYTKWLDVGHIDEIMAFAASAAGDAFSILRAAPTLAVRILDRLKAAQARGTLVTRLFRGKKWLHQSMPGGPRSHMPPRAYLSHASPKTSPYNLSGFTTPFTPSAGPYFDSVYHDDRRFLVFNPLGQVDARYAAFISCSDLLALVRTTNRAIEDLFLADTFAYADDRTYADYYESDVFKKDVLPARLDTVMKQAFPATPRIDIPVLFDRVDSFRHSSTGAVVPDGVNMQTLNDHVLVPRPYGPRMKTADAVTLVKGLIEDSRNQPLITFANSRLDAAFVRALRLDVTQHWTHANEWVNVAQIGKTPTKFDAAYEEMTISMNQAINASTVINTVPSAFDLLHKNDPYTNHPIAATETLRDIANYFKDGFDEFKNVAVNYCEGDTAGAHSREDAYEKSLALVMDRIRGANQSVFSTEGRILSDKWIAVVIPEETVDVFELYIQLTLMSVGLTVHWVDSWYYHTHSGGIHCATNVLRDFDRDRV